MRFNAVVGEVMNKNVRTVSMDTPISDVAKIMRDNRIGSVMVIGEKNVKGILTMSDIVHKHIADGIGKVASDIMSVNVISIAPNITVEAAAKIMVEKKIEKLPVFDKGRLVGIITNNDVIRIEPALIEILIEKMKVGLTSKEPTEFDNIPFGESQCEICGNYTDDVEEVGGVWTCSHCRLED